MQNKNLGTHLRMFLHDTPENWSIRVPFFAYAHEYSTIITSACLIIYNSFSYATFLSILSRKQFREYTEQYSSDLPLFSQYQLTDFNTLFHSIILKLFSICILAFERAVLQIYSKVYQFALEKNFSCIFNVKVTQSWGTITVKFLCYTSNFLGCSTSW